MIWCECNIKTSRHGAFFSKKILGAPSSSLAVLAHIPLHIWMHHVTRKQDMIWCDSMIKTSRHGVFFLFNWGPPAALWLFGLAFLCTFECIMSRINRAWHRISGALCAYWFIWTMYIWIHMSYVGIWRVSHINRPWNGMGGALWANWFMWTIHVWTIYMTYVLYVYMTCVSYTQAMKWYGWRAVGQLVHMNNTYMNTIHDVCLIWIYDMCHM